MSVFSEKTNARARELGRRFAMRFPRLAALLDRAGWIRNVVFVSLALLMLFGVLVIVDEIAKNPRQLLEFPVVALAVGFLALAVEWLWSLPGYVWLGLLLLLGINAIVSRLDALNAQMYSLIQEVRALTSKQDEGSEDFDDLDDEEF